MDDKTKKELIEKAKNFKTADEFIEWLGYETWMDEFTEAAEGEPMSESEIEEINDFLKDIFEESRDWTSDFVRSLRAKTGLSIQKFADKYGIPFRTFQDWELGNRVPPDYVVDMLAKIIDLENVSLTGWFFNEYRDKWGAGTNQMFATKEEALQEAKAAWDRLSDRDKKSYIDDPCGKFYVAEFPLVWDEDELLYQPATFDYTPVWSAI